MTVASDRFIRVFQYVLAIKYGAHAVEGLVRFGRLAVERGFSDAFPELWTLALGAEMFSTAVFLSLVLWIRSDRAAHGIAAMALVFGHGVLVMLAAGQTFANHFFLQAFVGLVGILAAGRQLAGESERRAWDQMAWLGIVVWGVGAAKKLLHTAYHDGEFFAMLGEAPRRTIFSFAADKFLGDADVPAQCCFTGALDVATPSAVALIVLSLGMVAAEFSPVVASRFAPRRVVGWIMLLVGVVATSIANEMSFGLILIAFASLWGEGRFFRRITVVIAIGLALAYLIEEL